ncbi:MAG: B12-binding domain-containing radical SAM protein [Nanoarchaeota archaeon]|nr:B12-binding domain-containing radical SAM protein [Nanoarchaeota archaeon]
MKVLLLKPYSESHYFVSPVGLGYLVSALRKHDIDVELIDGVKDQFTVRRMKEKIKKNPPDVIGISFFSSDFSVIKEYVNAIKEINKEILVILGGPHVAGVKKQIFEDFNNIDFAFAGEAETHFPLFLKKIQNNEDYTDTPGLIWKDRDQIKMNPSYFEEDLDKIGLPAWDLMDPRTYPKAPQGAVFRNWPIGSIVTSRGCPYQCTFCAGKLTTGQRIRKRSIENIMEEIELLYNKYGVREIHIIDDTFTSNKELVKGFCAGLKERDFKISLTFPNGVRLNSLDEEMLTLLKEAGCYAMSVGIESGNQKILNDMQKGLTLEIIEEKIKLINKFNIDINGFFIVGYPTETKETIMDTIKFARKLPIKRAHFSTFLPLPGTKATALALELGLLPKVDMDKLLYTDAPCPPKGLTSEDLKRFQRKAFFWFYIRPKHMIALLIEIKSWAHFKSLSKRAWDYGIKRVKYP